MNHLKAFFSFLRTLKEKPLPDAAKVLNKQKDLCQIGKGLSL
ncbi:hypothetical protein QY97_02962 [Bacillus thermotolerans]|nr:hypothetical protein QY97_02962 [Bacillus thermotolerans]